jgi:hypothetical protein
MSITLINAGPGTGKTFTIENGYRKLSRKYGGEFEPTEEQATIFDYLKTEFKDPNCSVCFFAHNNSTKEKLTGDLPKGTPVYTFHGAGSSALIRKHRFQKKVNNRSEQIIATITGKLLRDMPIGMKRHWYAIKKYVDYCKVETLDINQDSMNYIKLKYPDMSMAEFPDDWMDKASDLLTRSQVVNGSVEFIDMLWLGMRSVTKPIYDIGFVDESQDISKCAYSLVTRLCRNVVFCGDRNQAINAFAGASEEMYSYIEQISDAILPLKMTLRNPPFICDKANWLRPGGVIKGPNQGPGKEETIYYASLPEKLVTECKPEETLIISRTNAAIVSTAILLHKKGVPCRIVDKDLAEEIKKFFSMFYTQDIQKLYAKLDQYREQNTKSKNQLWVQFVEDKCNYCRQLLDQVKTWDQLMELLKVTFEKHLNGFKLCSIHKSKGLEAHNIFIINPPVELSIAMHHPIAREQEVNLHFVALTRSAMNLTWVVY